MNKTELKEAISKIADAQGITLPKSWQNKSEDNLAIMLDELENDEFDNDEVEVVTDAEVIVQPKISIAEIRQENKAMTARLKAEPHVDIEIEPSQAYPEGSIVPICVNGVPYRVPVGVYFPKGVPQSIYDAYRYSKTETRKANAAAKRKLTGEIKIQ